MKGIGHQGSPQEVSCDGGNSFGAEGWPVWRSRGFSRKPDRKTTKTLYRRRRALHFLRGTGAAPGHQRPGRPARSVAGNTPGRPGDAEGEPNRRGHVANTYMNQLGIIPWETYWTHGEVIRIMAELYHDAGASHIWVADALFGSDSYALGGYRDKLSSLAELIDLDQPGPSGDFIALPVPGPLRYPSFAVREEVGQCDHLAAISKMKCHQNCGLTLGLKGHIGLVPVGRYQLQPGDFNRSLLHGAPSETGRILPQG